MKKNKKLVIIVSVLLLGIGISLAYFLGKTLFTGDGATTKGTVATLNGATFTIEGELTFNDESIYPGHKAVSIIVGTATGDNVLIPYNIIWTGSNGLNTELKYTVYRSSEQKEVSATCEKKTKVRNGKQYLNEDCNISDLCGLEKVNEGTIGKKTESTEVYVANEEFITATNPSTKVYYYVIIEYPNLEDNQNEDIGGKFEGTLSAKLSEAKPDISIANIYLEQADGNFKETENIPDIHSYTFNEKMSTCTNDVKPIWNSEDNSLVLNFLVKNDTTCSLFFNINKYYTIDDILSSKTKATREDFTQILEEDTTGKIFTANDDDGETYYYSGSPTDNWVKFAGFYWKIVRVNGDGSVRLIYHGSDSSLPAQSISNAIYFNDPNSDNTYMGYMYGESDNWVKPEREPITKKFTFSSNTRYVFGKDYSYSDSKGQYKLLDRKGDYWSDKYVGYYTTLTTSAGDYVNEIYYIESYNSDTKEIVGYKYNEPVGAGKTTYETTHQNLHDSKIKETLDDWYDIYLADYEKFIDENAGFCNDREIYSGDGSGKNHPVYASNRRLRNDHKPTLKCANKERDLFTLQKSIKGNRALTKPIGLITADEIIYAGGGFDTYNKNFYLEPSTSFWTMTPYIMNGHDAFQFQYASGSIYKAGFTIAIGVRPVINLKSTTTFVTTGNGLAGSSTNPFIVSD